MAGSAAMPRTVPRMLIKPTHYIGRSTLIRLCHTNTNIVVDETGDGDDNKKVTTPAAKKSSPSRSYWDSGYDRSQVIGILNCLKKDTKEAISFFSQVKSRFQNDVGTYVKFISILCDSSLEERKLDSALLGLIKTEEGHPPCFKFFPLIQALSLEIDGTDDILDHKTKPSRAFNRGVNSLLRSYVSLGMFNQVTEVLSLWESCEWRIVPDVKSCNFFMSRLLEHGKEEAVLPFFKQMESMPIDPDEESYAIAIKAHFRMGSLDQVPLLFEEMVENHPIEDNYASYSSHIEEICLYGKFELGYEMYEDLINEDMSITASASKALISGLCAQEMLYEANKVFESMKDEDRDLSTYSELIRGFCKTKDFEEAANLYNQMVTEDDLGPDMAVFRLILEGLCSMGKFSDAVHLFKGRKMELDGGCYNSVMDSLCKVGRIGEALELFNEMKEKKMVRDATPYSTLIRGYTRANNISGALKIFEQMKANGFQLDDASGHADSKKKKQMNSK